MTGKKRTGKKSGSGQAAVVASAQPGDEAWRDAVRRTVKKALGRSDSWIFFDGVLGEPPEVVVSFALATPAALAPRLRGHDSFAAAMRAVHEALTAAQPALRFTFELVPAPFETSEDELAISLASAGERGLMAELGLEALTAELDEAEIEARSMTLQITRIGDAGARRIRVGQGRELRPAGEPLAPPFRPATAEESVDAAATEAQAFAPSAADAADADSFREWFPARMLERTTATSGPKFWLIARLGSTLSIRKGSRMRSLGETRVEHDDTEAAEAALEKRVARQLAKGYGESSCTSSLADAILYQEAVIPELDRPIVRRAARGLLATPEWRTTLSAQALVRALTAEGAPSEGSDADLARALVERVRAMEADA